MKCRECKHIETRGANEYCTYHDAYIGWHGCEYGEPKPQTNADRIRGMTDEELADIFVMEQLYKPCPSEEYQGHCKDKTDCRECWLNWLKSPVEEE